MLGNMFNFMQPAQVPQAPYGCDGFCETTVLASGVPFLNTALGVLSGVVGTYAVIEQVKLMQRMSSLASASASAADKFYSQASAKYTNTDVATFSRTSELYSRYLTFYPKENSYLSTAFALKEYCADNVGQKTLAVNRVSKFFTAANAQRGRIQGKACTKSGYANGTHFAVMNALMQTSAASVAIQRDEDFKREIDQWFWERWKDGARFVAALGDRAVRSLIAGASNVSTGIAGIGSAVGTVQQAADGQAGAIANSAQFWGNISNGAFNGMGQAFGGGSGGGGGLLSSLFSGDAGGSNRSEPVVNRGLK